MELSLAYASGKRVVFALRLSSLVGQMGVTQRTANPLLCLQRLAGRELCCSQALLSWTLGFPQCGARLWGHATSVN